MPENQTEIYYIAGDDIELMKKNPNISALKKRNFEVLLFDRPLDEFAFQEVRD